MATKTLKSRIKMKRDTSANWTKNDPILLNGEIIIVDTEAGETRYKIGDGTKKYSQLPFQDEIIKGAINNKQDKITATGILKGDGNGNITAATANTDYLPVSNPVLKGNPTAPTPTTDTSIANKKYVDDSISDAGFVEGEQAVYGGTQPCYTKQAELFDGSSCYIKIGGSADSDEYREVDTSETGIYLRRDNATSYGENYTQVSLSGAYTQLRYVNAGDEYQQTSMTMGNSSLEIEAEETINGSATNINYSKITIIPTGIGIKTPSLNLTNVTATTGCPTPTVNTSIANKQYVDDALGNIVQVRTVSLPTSSWTENDGYYSQKFVFTGGSGNSKVDFQVDSASYSILKDSGTYLLQPVNESGLFYAYAYGGKPNADLSIQISFMGAQVI